MPDKITKVVGFNGHVNTLVTVSLVDMANEPETVEDVEDEVRMLKAAVEMYGRFISDPAGVRPSRMQEHLVEHNRSRRELGAAERKLARMKGGV